MPGQDSKESAMRQRRAVPKPQGFRDSMVPTLLQSKGCACGLLGNL